jgi:hypothetical protein
MKLEAKDVSFFPVSPAMSLSEDRSWEAYKTMAADEKTAMCNYSAFTFFYGGLKQQAKMLEANQIQGTTGITKATWKDILLMRSAALKSRLESSTS